MLTLPDTVTACAAEVNALLCERYLAVLERHDLVTIAQSEKAGVFSGLFLPAVDDAYLQSVVRVMLVGQEPKKWGRTLHALVAEPSLPAALRPYVELQMAAYRRFASTPPRKIRFRQFHCQLHDSLRSQVGAGHNAIFWANLLCMSRHLGSPSKSSAIVRIAALSRDLLNVQFEVLRPHLVVFATGYGYDRFLKAQIDDDYTTLQGRIPKQYWPFKAHKAQFTAWRVRHPRRLTKDVKRKLLNSVVAAAQLCRNEGVFQIVDH